MNVEDSKVPRNSPCPSPNREHHSFGSQEKLINKLQKANDKILQKQQDLQVYQKDGQIFILQAWML